MALGVRCQAERRKQRVDRERRLEGLAVEMLTALGEQDSTIAATEQRAVAALQAMAHKAWSMWMAKGLRWYTIHPTGPWN